ncbi:MAG: ABC transporter ATP-binding protein [Lachnospiraceae bacterium]|nr:ABC transporter ATP-binding protein [Lachnospiraceae bacterium]
MILCENLVKIYKTKETEVLALQGLELKVEKGEFIAIIGSSGSGKSTFLNMIGGLDRPSAGKLYVDGKDLFKMTESQLVDYKKNTVGFVWQNNARNLFPYLTALQNVELPIRFGDNKDVEKRALDLLNLVGMAHKKDSKLNQMSGGEQQRIAIAIALANRPKLLLADEPTGSVDQRTSDALLDVFRRLNQELGITIVIVTHDINLAKKVKRVVMMRDGKTSSERIIKQEFADPSLLKGFVEEETHDEFAILDRAGRVQIPREMLDAIGVKGNRIRLQLEDGQILVTNGESEDGEDGDDGKDGKSGKEGKSRRKNKG